MSNPQSDTIQHINVKAEDLPDLLLSLEDEGKKIIIHVTEEITWQIRENIQTAFYRRGSDLCEMDISIDLSKTVWDSLYSVNSWLVRSISFPDGVTDIWGGYISSPTLEEIIVSETNPTRSSMDGVLYNKDKTMLIRCPSAKEGLFKIPDTVTTVSAYAFSRCGCLTEIIIPESVTVIEDGDFERCYSIKEINIPNSVTEIGLGAFEECRSLEQIRLPDSVTKMDARVFAECKNLKSVIFSDNLSEIPDTTFLECQSLESISIPPHIKRIGVCAFRLCSSLSHVKIPAGIKKIDQHAFFNCPSLASIEVPDSTDVAFNAFDEHTKIIRKLSMIEIQGRYNTAKVFTDDIDSDAYAQVLQMMNQVWSRNMSVRIMPDVHAGKGCTVGTTMTIEGRIVPNLVGVDIGCGVDVLVVKKDFGEIDLALLDEIVHNNIPAGAAARTKPHAFIKELEWNAFLAPIDVQNSKLQLGSLGGGNHFIEADRDEDGNYYFVIHSGSRHLGKEICDFYQDIAIKYTKAKTKERGDIITKLKNEGREAELEEALSKIDHAPCSTELSYIESDDLEHYLHDMELAQKYAALNRRAMLDEIKTGLGIKKGHVIEEFSTVHNYIDIKNKILRKGSISAQEGERVIIPMNMRDGSLICTGKGNPDWNFSAPHGAGRLYKRSESKELFTVEEYQNEMKGIYSTSIGQSTLDESPMAYKPMEQIIEKIQPTVKVEKIIKPIYNFKTGGM